MSHTAPPARRLLPLRTLPPTGLALLLLAALTGCNGSRFGDNLARSFSSPAPATTAPATAPATTAATAATGSGSAGSAGSGGKQGGVSGASPASPSTSGTARPPGSAPAAPAASPTNAGGTAAPGTTPPGTATGAPPTGARPGTSGATAAAPSNPTRSAPYRVTILLPQADAAAPAEVVTQALRAAGVPFEVETIERQGGSAAPNAPVSRPAPAPR